MWEILGGVALLVGLWLSIYVISGWQELLRLRFYDYQRQPFEPWNNPIPEALVDSLARLESEVKALNLHLVAVLKLPKISPDLPDLPCFIFQKNSHEATFLLAFPPSYYLSPNDFHLTFLTLCDDGNRVVTYSYQNFDLEPPLANELANSVNHFDPVYVDAFHHELLKLTQIIPIFQAFTASQTCDFINHVALQRLETQLATGNFRLYQSPSQSSTFPTPPSHYRYKFWYALRLSLQRLLFRKSDSMDTPTNIMLQGITDIPIPPARQRLFLVQFSEHKNIDLFTADKVTFLVLTCVMSCLLGLLIFDLTTVLSLMLVVFLHEVGHFLAMKWAGYKNATIYMIPLLGGVATGVQQKSSENRETWVLLAGPLPGLLLSFSVLLAINFGFLPSQLPEYGMDFLQQLVLINAFNLLPIMPLDGGKLFQIVFSGKALPIGKVIAVVISILAVGFAMFEMQSFLLTLIFALPLLMVFKKSPASPSTLLADRNVQANDSRAMILQKLYNKQSGILAFREHLQTSHDVWMKANHTSAFILNKIIISLILLLNPIISYIMFTLAWSLN